MAAQSATAPAANDLSTLDSAGDVGSYTSFTVGADGLGLVRLPRRHERRPQGRALLERRLYERNQLDTRQRQRRRLLTSVTVGADGLGLVSYYDTTNDDLKVAHCSNAACTSATSSTLDSAANVGSYTSVTVGADGLGLVSYLDGTNDDLKVAHCSNAACTTRDAARPRQRRRRRRYTSVTIGADGLGLISYQDDTNGLKVAHCSNVPVRVRRPRRRQRIRFAPRLLHLGHGRRRRARPDQLLRPRRTTT